MKKIISILMVIIMICLIFNVNFVLAGGSESQITDITSIVNKMEPSNDMSNTNNRFGNILNIIIGLLQVVGTGIAVIAVAILGMKYMMAAPSEKADTKKSIMPILIGCLLLFGAVNLMAVVYNFSKEVLKN